MSDKFSYGGTVYEKPWRSSRQRKRRNCSRRVTLCLGRETGCSMVCVFAQRQRKYMLEKKRKNYWSWSENERRTSPKGRANKLPDLKRNRDQKGATLQSNIRRTISTEVYLCTVELDVKLSIVQQIAYRWTHSENITLSEARWSIFFT